MFQQLFFALVLTSVTVLLHSVGTVHIDIPATGIWKQVANSTAIARPVWTLVRIVSLLLVLHLLEIAMWAATYGASDVLPDFETAPYYSLKSDTTVGYGDVLPTVS